MLDNPRHLREFEKDFSFGYDSPSHEYKNDKYTLPSFQTSITGRLVQTINVDNEKYI